MKVSVRRAVSQDLDGIGSIHQDAFPRQRESKLWVQATLAAAPRMFVYALLADSVVVGYIFWAQKSGIRAAAVIELDQIAVRSDLRGQGLGSKLIEESLGLVTAELALAGQTVKSALVSTRADNASRHLYARILGATVVAEIDNLYSSSEVLMVANLP